MQPPAAAAAAPAGAGTSPPFDGGCAREAGRAGAGGRGTDGGSRRSGAAWGAAGNVSTQVCKYYSRIAVSSTITPAPSPLVHHS